MKECFKYESLYNVHQYRYCSEMSDIDSNDYVDIGENILADDSNDNVEAVVTEKASGKGRGRDIEWIEVERFSDCV